MSHRFAGWIGDGRGPDMHLIADRPPSQKSLEALFAVRDAVLASWAQAELAAGRWEDDGGPPAPERVRVRSLLSASRADNQRKRAAAAARRER